MARGELKSETSGGSTMHVVVHGVVQGVGFRWFVRERARRLGLAGWVRNRDDGTVEVAASGDRGQLDLLRGELGRGPNGAVVKRIEDLDIQPDSQQELEAPFTILR